ncbi:MAG: hypothetical protein U9N38_03470, partial [Thermodesulfobacteriota bacterium]|nr:hypothetical protein [Thermodesulfobacteriota bacterium]
KHTYKEVKIIQIDEAGQVTLLPDDWDLNLLKSGSYTPTKTPENTESLPWDKWRQTYEGTIGAVLTQTRLKVENPLSARVKLLGLSLLI